MSLVNELHFDLPFQDPRAAALCREFLEADMAKAELPRSFRLYYRARRLIPLVVRQWLQQRRNQRLPVTSQWYLPRDFCDRLSESMQRESVQLPRPWPRGNRFAFVLTHDVETSEGLRKVAEIADLEEKLGFRSSWNIVPYKYAIDEGLLRDLRTRGFEIGIHGFNHDGTLFWSESRFRRRARSINAALQRYGADGFRAPMAHRNLRWMQALDIQYDSSCFDVDPFQAMPGGVGSYWPFVAGRFVELPYTLPQDHTLLITLGETTDRIWRDKLASIKQWSGMALMLTHPDYLDTPQRRRIYRDFLLHVREGNGYWHALPCEMARWWKQGAQDAAKSSLDSKSPLPVETSRRQSAR